MRLIRTAWVCGMLLSGAAVALIGSVASAGTIVYVDDDAPAGGDGTSWATAFRFLQDGLAFAAVPEHGVTEVRVAQGVYKPDRSETTPGGTGDRTATFHLLNGVALRGGYLGLSAGLREDSDTRNVQILISALSGDLSGNDQPSFVNYAENSLHVVNANLSSSTAILDGVTIASGNASGPGSFSLEGRGGGAQIINGDARFISCTFRDIRGLDGGAIYIELGEPAFDVCVFEGNWGQWGGAISNEGSPTITACEFTNNVVLYGGGAIFSERLGTTTCAPLIDSCVFVANVSLSAQPGRFEGGGAVFNSHGVEIVIRDCHFEANVAARGGAIRNGGASPMPEVGVESCNFIDNRGTLYGGAVEGSEATYIHCQFYNNTAGLAGGAYSSGGVMDHCVFAGNSAMYGGAGAGSGWFTNCEFDNNQAEIAGGAVYGETFEFDNCKMRFNSAPEGGAVHLPEGGISNVQCVRTLFLGNTADRGGAVWLAEAYATFASCRFIGNEATLDSGGGLLASITELHFVNCLFVRNVAAGAGGALASYWGQTRLVNCTMAFNESGDTGGAVAGNATLRNSILWSNSPDQLEAHRFTDVEYCDVEGGWGEPKLGNIDADPLFVDVDGADEVLGTEDDNFRLRPGSACVDSAWNSAVFERITTDLAGRARFVDDPSMPDTGAGSPPIVDMGAYEFNPACIADVHPTPDGDGAINIGDLLFIIQYWGATGAHSADVTFDGTVGIADLLAVIAAWGTCA